MEQIRQSSIDEVAAVSAAVAAPEQGPKRTFTLTIEMDNEAFGDDQWDREAEVGRILRELSMDLYGSGLPKRGGILDRNGNRVGRFEFLTHSFY